MSVKIALLGFGTVASGVPFLLKENGEKIFQSAQSEIEVAKVLVKDEDEKNRLLAAGNDFNFVTNIGGIDGTYRACQDLYHTRFGGW